MTDRQTPQKEKLEAPLPTKEQEKDKMSYREPQFQDEPPSDGGDEFYDEEIVIDPSAEFTGPIEGLEELKEQEAKEARRARRRAERRRQRDLRTGKIVAACLCVCIIIAVIITISVLKGVERYIEYGPGGQPHHPPSYNASHHQDQNNDVTGGGEGGAGGGASTPAGSSPSTNSTGGINSDVGDMGTVQEGQSQSESTTNNGGNGQENASEQQQAGTTSPPTKAPTPSPTVPATPRPTLPLQESYVFMPTKDTFVYIDGPDKTKFYGSEESFLVQLGTKVEKPGVPLERATAKAILQFDTSMLPDRSVWPTSSSNADDGTASLPINATLKVHHIAFKDRDDLQDQPNVDVESRSPVRMEVWRLPNSINPDLNIETMTGDTFVSNIPVGDRTGYLVKTHDVAGDDGWIEVDIHDALFLPERMNDDPRYTDEKIILMLSIWPGDSTNKQLSVIGDRFHSRESSDDGFSPQLTINNMI